MLSLTLLYRNLGKVWRKKQLENILYGALRVHRTVIIKTKNYLEDFDKIILLNVKGKRVNFLQMV